jgi:hypothetical protein
LEIQTRSQVFIFRSIASLAERRADLRLADADVMLEGEQEYDLDDALWLISNPNRGALATTPGLDLNRDNIDDLVIGGGVTDLIGDTLIQNAGKIYAIYGSLKLFRLPSSDIITLPNRTVTGSGDFLVDDGSGQPVVFEGQDIDGDGKNDFLIPVGQEERWYRFTTLGDGQAGDQIRLTKVAEAAHTVHLNGTDAARLIQLVTGAFQVDQGPISIGDEDEPDMAILEFDLSAFLDRPGRSRLPD